MMVTVTPVSPRGNMKVLDNPLAYSGRRRAIGKSASGCVTGNAMPSASGCAGLIFTATATGVGVWLAPDSSLASCCGTLRAHVSHCGEPGVSADSASCFDCFLGRYFA